MEESTDRELEAILELIKLTQEGAIAWQPVKPSGDLIENNTVKYTNVMQCIYGGKYLRIYTEKKLKEKPTAAEKMSLSELLGEGRTYPYWASVSVLEITNDEGQSLWRFAYKPAIKDLLNAAKYQASGVKEFLDDILSK